MLFVLRNQTLLLVFSNSMFHFLYINIIICYIYYIKCSLALNATLCTTVDSKIVIRVDVCSLH